MEPFLRRDACQNRGAGGGDNEHRRCPPHTDRGADTDTNGGTYAYAHSHADDSACDADTDCPAYRRTYHGTDSPAYRPADTGSNACPVANTHTVAQPGDTEDCRRA